MTVAKVAIVICLLLNAHSVNAQGAGGPLSFLDKGPLSDVGPGSPSDPSILYQALQQGSYHQGDTFVQTHLADIGCKADWDGECSFSKEIVALPGYQACRIETRVVSQEEEAAKWSIKPSSFFNGDIESPERFSGYTISVHAKGNQQLFNQVRGQMIVQVVKFVMIPATFNNSGRFQNACDIPLPP